MDVESAYLGPTTAYPDLRFIIPDVVAENLPITKQADDRTY
jgi:hypothetical protein